MGKKKKPTEKEPHQTEKLKEEPIHINEFLKDKDPSLHKKGVDRVDYKDKYLRQLAETENMRKRLEEEKKLSIHFAVEHFIETFLKPIDQLEQALNFAQKSSDEVKNWAIGFNMILEQFHEALKMQGVSQFSSLGEPFDPMHHEAIEMIESKEHKSGTIVEEMLKGYKKGEKIIRAAQVKVAKEPAEESTPHEVNKKIDREGENHE